MENIVAWLSCTHTHTLTQTIKMDRPICRYHRIIFFRMRREPYTDVDSIMRFIGEFFFLLLFVSLEFRQHKSFASRTIFGPSLFSIRIISSSTSLIGHFCIYFCKTISVCISNCVYTRIHKRHHRWTTWPERISISILHKQKAYPNNRTYVSIIMIINK